MCIAPNVYMFVYIYIYILIGTHMVPLKCFIVISMNTLMPGCGVLIPPSGYRSPTHYSIFFPSVPLITITPGSGLGSGGHNHD